uniref:Uncharacterized protein n=1 Tax=Craspedostauros australis TaxID=1486917 RepID=A0A6T6EUV7_9STRA|mmetsp:Transcript_18289/g.50767  ORF Transcript_18289/g.50767 Transcript_18289/m.50767 type:complete len:169 (+) Transcript_18289:80-586(+)
MSNPTNLEATYVINAEDDASLPVAQVVSVEAVGYAPTLPTTASQFSEDAERRRVAEAQMEGLIAAQRQRAAVQTGLRRAQQHQDREMLDTRRANEVARRRDREGLQIRNEGRMQEQAQKLSSAATVSSSTSAAAPATSTSSGYQCKEYQPVEYSTSSYEVSEYKSVYD